MVRVEHTAVLERVLHSPSGHKIKTGGWSLVLSSKEKTFPRIFFMFTAVFPVRNTEHRLKTAIRK